VGVAAALLVKSGTGSHNVCYFRGRGGSVSKNPAQSGPTAGPLPIASGSDDRGTGYRSGRRTNRSSEEQEPARGLYRRRPPSHVALSLAPTHTFTSPITSLRMPPSCPVSSHPQCRERPDPPRAQLALRLGGSQRVNA
jgi:hypothetical protein